MIVNTQEVVFEPKIRYPNSKDFGVWAWATASQKLAFDKFLELNNEQTK